MAAIAEEGRPELAPAPIPGVVAPLQGGYRTYAMSLLVGVYVFNYLDRTIINILAEPIKRDLRLADWQLGLMSGLAFAVLYTTLGIPAARLAERQSRPLIIAVSAAIWSACTALCGLTQTLGQLLLARVGVGVGEAGCTPPAQSLIVDYAPREKRASLLATYSMGAPLGTLVGMVFGGLIADAYGWRTAFFVAGAPGLAFAVLAAATLKEPRRRISQAAARAMGQAATFGETVRFLAAKRTFRYLALGAAMKSFVGYGIGPFIASFYLRNHMPQLEQLSAQLGGVFGYDLRPVGFMGLALGLSSGLAGMIGAIAGGWIGDRLGARDARAYMLVPSVAALLSIPPFLGAVMLDNVPAALLGLSLYTIIASLWYGPVYSTAYSIVPPHMRATTSALLLFVMNLIGLGLGPLAVGTMSDLLAGPGGLGPAEGLRWALIASSAVGLIAMVLFWIASRTVREDLMN